MATATRRSVPRPPEDRSPAEDGAGPPRWGRPPVAGTAALAGPAHALAAASAPVDFATHCVPPPIAGIPPIDGTTTAQITVDNATPKVGDTVTVTYTVVKPAASNPVDLALPADIMTPSGKVALGGAQTGNVTVAGPKKNPPVPGKGAFPSFSMTGTFTVTAPGAITLSPGDYNIHTSYIMELDTPCTVISPPAPVSETVTATDQPGANTRAIQLATASGKPGDSVTVTGANFTPVADGHPRRPGRARPDRRHGDRRPRTPQGGFTAPRRSTTRRRPGSWRTRAAPGRRTRAPVRPRTSSSTTPRCPATARSSPPPSKAGTLSMSQAGDAVELSAVDFGRAGPRPAP